MKQFRSMAALEPARTSAHMNGIRGMWKMGRTPMIEFTANPALRTFIRTWSVILVASAVGMAVLVVFVLWATTGFHGLGIEPVTGVALVLGAMGATALCVFLMGLLFYSDSSGKDEAINRQAKS